MVWFALFLQGLIGLELKTFLCLCLPVAGITGVCHHAQHLGSSSWGGKGEEARFHVAQASLGLPIQHRSSEAGVELLILPSAVIIGMPPPPIFDLGKSLGGLPSPCQSGGNSLLPSLFPLSLREVPGEAAMAAVGQLEQALSVSYLGRLSSLYSG